MTPLTSALLEAANLAPSAHNTQPWRLRFVGDDQLEVWADLKRALTAADPDNRDLLHALGTLIENCQLTLAHHGFHADVRYADQLNAAQPVAVLRWPVSPGQPVTSELYRMIPIRRTSRIAFSETTVAPGVLTRLQTEVSAPYRLRIITTAPELALLGKIAAAADLALLQQPAMCTELRRWLRLSRADPSWYRDGLNAECMGWSRFEALVAGQLIKPSMVRLLEKLGLARMLLSPLPPSAPAICLLTAPAEAFVAGRVESGRQLQRVWLAAAAAGLCTHPLSAAVDHEASRAETFRLFGVGTGEVHVNLFRLGFSPLCAHSHRLPVDEILHEFPWPDHG